MASKIYLSSNDLCLLCDIMLMIKMIKNIIIQSQQENLKIPFSRFGMNRVNFGIMELPS